MIYLNNFFSLINLFKKLKDLRIEAVKTLKQSFNFDENLLMLKTVITKAKNKDIKAVITVNNNVLYMI